MKKRLLCLTLALLTVASYPLAVWALEGETETAAPTVEAAVQTEVTQEIAQDTVEAAAQEPVEVVVQEPAVANQFAIFVNGQSVPDAHSILEAGTTYVSVLHTVEALCPEVTYSWAGGDADVVYTGPGFTLQVRYGRSYLVCNDRYLYIPGGIRVHPQDGDLIVPVRVLAKALGAEVGWDGDGVYLTPGQPLESGSTFYNATDLDLLSRVIQHESGNQPLAGKIAVAQVILNRVKAGSRAGFADSVSGVLNQKGQFPGATNATPKSEAILAAKLAMDGADVVPGAYWFNGVGKSFWASQNKSLLATIGNHSFYG